MGELLVKEKEIVIPGEIIAKGMDYIPGSGAFREGEDLIADRLGVVSIAGRAIKIIPLSGQYVPKKGDVVIGKVIDILMFGWRLDINSAYTGMLNLKDATTEYIAKGEDLSSYYQIGDYLIAKVVNVTSQILVDLSMKGPGLHKLEGGRIVRVNTNKVPRIIGKQGSMVNLIKRYIPCKIIVGQNGRIWVKGEPRDELRVVKIIKMIEAKSHMSGLTEIIKEKLEEEKEE